MPKQKKKRNKTYTPKNQKKKGLKVPTKQIVKSLENKMPDFFKEWFNGKEGFEAFQTEFEIWKKYTFKKDSKNYEFAVKFLEWFNFNIEKGRNVFAYHHSQDKKYKIKQSKILELNEEYATILTKINKKEGKKWEPSLLTCQRLNGLSEDESMLVYNSDGRPFVEEYETVIREKEIIKKETKTVEKIINQDKPSEQKLKKLKKYLAKPFKKDYLISADKILENINKIIN